MQFAQKRVIIRLQFRKQEGDGAMIKQFLRKYGWRYLPGVFFLVLNSYVLSLTPIYLGNAIDGLNRPASEIDKHYVYMQVLLLVIAAVGAFLTRYCWRYFINGNARNLEVFLRENLFVKYQNMPTSFFNSNKTGDLMALAINDIGAVRQTASMALANILTGCSTLFFAMLNMFSEINPKLTGFSLLPIPFAILSVVLIGKKVRIRFLKVQQMFAQISGKIQEDIMGMRVIKAFHQEDNTIRSFIKSSDEMRDANIKLAYTSSLLNPLIQIFFGLSFMISLILGSNMVMGNEISVGELTAFNDYLIMIMAPIIALGRVINSFEKGSASMRRLNDVFQLSQIEEKEYADYDHDIQGNIQVNHLTYAYENDAMNVLDDISFEIKQGESLGIIGETGSGKTTLIDLLLKFLPVPRGSIYIDGVDLCDIPSKAIRESIGYVPQEEFLFNTTIAQNISFYQEDCTPEVIDEVSEYSDLKKDMYKFSNGYDTPVGERGHQLSGGQKKRVIIARAIVKHPRILIFDDVLSSVDVNTEQRILKNLQKTMKGKTSIIISQRISALRDATRIIYLQDGKIVEYGTHEQLMEQNGKYAHMYRQQSKNADADADVPDLL